MGQRDGNIDLDTSSTEIPGIFEENSDRVVHLNQRRARQKGEVIRPMKRIQQSLTTGAQSSCSVSDMSNEILAFLSCKFERVGNWTRRSRQALGIRPSSGRIEQKRHCPWSF